MNPLFFDDTRFYRETVVDIDAAIVGVSRIRWEALETAQATPEHAADVMRRNHFDVLPIVDGATVREYFCTAVWGDYSQIRRQRIERQDIIPHQTHIRDVVRGLAMEERPFYFLSYEHHIVGLLSVANLNCRQMKIYLFSLLSELEIRLGAFITKQVPDEAELRKLTLDSGKEKYSAVKVRFDADRANGLDAPLVEYLYLADLLTISAQRGLFAELGFASRSTFEKQINPLNDLRNGVAHPNRSLITSADSVKKLWRDIDLIEELLFRLR
jgi:hypothetical protein